MKSFFALLLLSSSSLLGQILARPATFVSFVPNGGSNLPVSGSFNWTLHEGGDGDGGAIAGLDKADKISFNGDALLFYYDVTVADAGSAALAPLTLSFQTDGLLTFNSFFATLSGLAPVDPALTIESVQVYDSYNFSSGAIEAFYSPKHGGSLLLASSGPFTVENGSTLSFEFVTSTSAVPEPATVGACLGVAALGFAAWRRRRAVQAGPSAPQRA